MMKKANVVVGALVLSTMFMGVGYAYFAEELKVESTVETAQFNVYFSDVVAQKGSTEGSSDSSYVELPLINTSSSNLSTFISQDGAHINFEKDRATFRVENMYPGSKVRFIATVRNDSTIPVKVVPKVTTKNIDAANGTTNELLKYLSIQVNNQEVNSNKREETNLSLEQINLEESNDQNENDMTEIIIDVCFPSQNNISDMKEFMKCTEKQKAAIEVALDWQQFNYSANTVGDANGVSMNSINGNQEDTSIVNTISEDGGEN